MLSEILKNKDEIREVNEILLGNRVIENFIYFINNVNLEINHTLTEVNNSANNNNIFHGQIGSKIYGIRLFSLTGVVDSELVDKVQLPDIKQRLEVLGNQPGSTKTEFYLNQYLIPEIRTLLSNLQHKSLDKLNKFKEFNEFLLSLKKLRDEYLSTVGTNTKITTILNLISYTTTISGKYYSLKSWIENNLRIIDNLDNEQDYFITLPTEATPENIADLLNDLHLIQELYNKKLEQDKAGYRIQYIVKNISSGSTIITIATIMIPLVVFGPKRIFESVKFSLQARVFLVENMPKLTGPNGTQELYSLGLQNKIITQGEYDKKIKALEEKKAWQNRPPIGKDTTIKMDNLLTGTPEQELIETTSEEKIQLNVSKINEFENNNKFGKAIRLAEDLVEDNPENFIYLKKLIELRSKVLSKDDIGNREALKNLILQAKNLISDDEFISEIEKRVLDLENSDIKH